MHDVLDDDQLLGALGAAMGARRTVPVKFVQTATNAYAWHNIDSELARISHYPSPNPDFLPRGHAAPRVTRDSAVACSIGSSASPRLTRYRDSARVWPSRR
jgi:hypothetical protein